MQFEFDVPFRVGNVSFGLLLVLLLVSVWRRLRFWFGRVCTDDVDVRKWVAIAVFVELVRVRGRR